MIEAQQPLIARLKVVHDARFNLLLGLATTLCAGAIWLKPSAATTSASEWLVVLISAAIFGFGLLTRSQDCGSQPVQVFTQGLQIGTLFQDLRATELRDCEVQGNAARLRGRLLTLQLTAESADAATLHARIARLGVPPESESVKRRRARALMLLPFGTLLLILLHEVVLTPESAMLMSKSLPLVMTLLSGSALITEGMRWVRLKRDGYRV